MVVPATLMHEKRIFLPYKVLRVDPNDWHWAAVRFPLALFSWGRSRGHRIQPRRDGVFYVRQGKS